MLLALGITRDIFKTDVLAMHKECPVGQMPILIKIKDLAKDKPVWLSGNEEKPWTAASTSNLLKKLMNKLGWQSNVFIYHTNTIAYTKLPC